MLIRKQTTNLVQIFCEISLHSQVIFKSIKVADDISRGTLECEWVKQLPYPKVINPFTTVAPKKTDYFGDIFITMQHH